LMTELCCEFRMERRWRSKIDEIERHWSVCHFLSTKNTVEWRENP